MFDLTGKVCLVTGGNGGIGLGIAKGLKEAGAQVVIWGRNIEKSVKTDLAYDIVDVSQEDQVEIAMDKIVLNHGKIDFVVANAGITSWSTPFHEITKEEWREIFSVNMEGVFFTFKHAISNMIKHGEGGSLMGISSGTAIFGFPRAEHYAATKMGVIAMVRCIAVEYARHGIRANAVIPGWIQTDMTQPLIDHPKFAEKNLKRIPMRRWGQPSDIAPMAVYFASDESSYHTGDTVTVDGAYCRF
jgi:NAD(P)-dependent dehydrogenase (short-subunit alcohol dehydrogenase family)